MQRQYIATDKQLQELCLSLSKSPVIFLDTEFIRQNTYYPELALIQITDGNLLAIIDPVQIEDLQDLLTLCNNPDIIKVFHSGKQDLEIFFLLSGKVPYPVFDTQIAAALMGLGTQIGYASLVEKLLNLSLDKSQTRTNWLQRPLTEKQLNYAANDVIYLEQIYHILHNQLNQLKRLNWLDDDFKQLARNETFELDLMTLWKKIKGYNKLKPHQLVILQYLTKYREEQAVKLNKPRRNVISDQLLINLAIEKPTNIEQLVKIYGFHKTTFSKSFANGLITSIETARTVPTDKHPTNKYHYKLNYQQSALTDCLMAICHLRAEDNNISTSYLCQRNELEKFTMRLQEISLMSGWRYKLVGKHLQSFINGECHLSITNNQLRLD